MTKSHPLFFLLLALCHSAVAAEFYVDPAKGDDQHDGSSAAPFATLVKAVATANALTDTGPLAIKLLPGLYVLPDKVTLHPQRQPSDEARYTIEAAILPDAKNWSPEKMPVIQSVSADNSVAQFPHAVGFLVATSNVSFRGLKFIGNPNPAVVFYYPITKEDKSLGGLHVSQCYFISETNAVPIQGGIWAHGPATAIDHCIFYDCRNAILLFNNVDGFAITHSIIYGANESAIWMGPIDSNFVFKNNVVSHCHYFWVRPENSRPAYRFSDCIIADNNDYTGYYTNTGLVPVASEGDKNIVETNVVKTGHVLLVQKSDEHLPADLLNLAPDSVGHDLGAGLFTAAR